MLDAINREDFDDLRGELGGLCCLKKSSLRTNGAGRRALIDDICKPSLNSNAATRIFLPSTVPQETLKCWSVQDDERAEAQHLRTPFSRTVLMRITRNVVRRFRLRFGLNRQSL